MTCDRFARRLAVLGSALLAAMGAACATRAPQAPTPTIGVASWYGPGFHGRATASGERYDQHGMTAAHRTWPLGTPVRVTRLDTGRSVVVRINDRGPYVDDREIDLSYEAARRLGIVRHGTARVRLEPASAGAERRAVRFAVQVGSFLTEPHATALQRRVAALREVRGPSLPRVPRHVYVAKAHRDETTLYRVRVGLCASREDAQVLATELARAGLDPMVVEEVVALR